MARSPRIMRYHLPKQPEVKIGYGLRDVELNYIATYIEDTELTSHKQMQNLPDTEFGGE